MTAALTSPHPASMIAEPVKSAAYARGTCLGPHVEDYLTWKRYDQGCVASTIEGYRYPLARMSVVLRDSEPAEVTLDELRGIRATFPPKSVSYVTAVYRHFWEWMELEERVPVSPARRLRAPRRRKEIRTRIFTDAEVNALQAQPLLRDGALMTLMFDSGIRMGEARKLRLLHVNLKEGEVNILGGKGDKDRVIDLSDFCVYRINDLALLDGLEPTDFLWYGYRDGPGKRTADSPITRDKPIDNNRFYRWWYGCLDEVDVPYVKGEFGNPHQARHTYASRWLRDSGNISMLTEFMGHESVATTKDTYGHFQRQDLKAEVRRLEVLRGERVAHE